MKQFKRTLSLITALALAFAMLTITTFAEEQQEVQEPQQEIQQPQEEVQEPQEEAQEPQEEVQEPQEEAQEPQEEVQEPQEEVQEPQEETQEPQEEVQEPQEEAQESLASASESVEAFGIQPFAVSLLTSQLDLTTNTNISEDKLDTEGWKWEYSADGSTLTLNGLNMQVSRAVPLKLPGNTTIVLDGDATIQNEAENTSRFLIDVTSSGYLNITGNGTLELVCNTPGGGIQTNQGDITISGSDCEVSVVQNYSSDFSASGIKANWGNLTIEEATVTVDMRSGSGLQAVKSSATTDGKLIIESGEVQVTTAGIHPINASNDIEIKGGNVTATSTNSSTGGYGIYSNSNVTISGGTVTATSARTGTVSKGINANNGTITFSGESTEINANGFGGALNKEPVLNDGILPYGNTGVLLDKATAWSTTSSTVTYKAVAQPSSFTVSFDANGGSVTPASTTTDANGKLANLPTPTRGGYSFNGWFTESSGGTRVTTNTVFEEDTTIYAQWSQTTTPTSTSTPRPSYTSKPTPTPAPTSTPTPKPDFIKDVTDSKQEVKQDVKINVVVSSKDDSKTDDPVVSVTVKDSVLSVGIPKSVVTNAIKAADEVSKNNGDKTMAMFDLTTSNSFKSIEAVLPKTSVSELANKVDNLAIQTKFAVLNLATKIEVVAPNLENRKLLTTKKGIIKRGIAIPKFYVLKE